MLKILMISIGMVAFDRRRRTGSGKKCYCDEMAGEELAECPRHK